MVTILCRGEFKEHHQKWFVEINPKLAPEVDARVKFALAAHLDGLHRIALKVKEETRVVLNDLLLV
jgi:amidase